MTNMHKTIPPKENLDSEAALKARLKAGKDFSNIVIQNIDLRKLDGELAGKAWENSVFLGCHLGPIMAARAVECAALIFPPFDGKDYDPYRSTLYKVAELYRGFDPADAQASYAQTPDYKVFQSYKDVVKREIRAVSIDETMARHIHDNSIDTALQKFLVKHRGQGVVAIMGGHDRLRNDPAYAKVANLSRELTRKGFLLVSGGGPGLMEATNLGAYLAAHPDEALTQALTTLAEEPSWKDTPRWITAAWKVLRQFPRLDGARNLGIPTWFYGHEPPNLFATHIAKYFDNSIREEGLLAIATHGVVYAEGNAGTVQEIFQDACQNYYRTYGFSSPMIFYGKTYWNPGPGEVGKPAYPLVQRLAAERRFSHLVHTTDDAEEISLIIQNYRPIKV